MKAIFALSTYALITIFVVTVSAQTTKTDPKTGNSTTSGPSDKYGPGGTHESVSNNKYKLIEETYKDKNGKVREKITPGMAPGTTVTQYSDENGTLTVIVTHSRQGDAYTHPDGTKMDPKEGKALVEKLENTPSTTPSEKAPEKPKEEPKTKSANGDTTTDMEGNVTTAGPSDKYGPGGTHEKIVDKDGDLMKEIYRDKSGEVRERTALSGPESTKITSYYDENGEPVVWIKHTPEGDVYYKYEPTGEIKMDPKDGKALVEKMEKTPSAGPPEKPKEEPTTKPETSSGVLPISSSQLRVETTGTGETIGHVADLLVQNLTDQTIECAIPPMILESRSGKNQTYACPKGRHVALKPHELKTIPMDGVCLNRDKPPVGKGVAGDLGVNDGSPNVGQDLHLKPKDTDKLLRLCEAKYEAADKLQKDSALKDLPYYDKQKQKDIVVQWSTWSDPRICELTGAPPATKDDLKKVVYKQVPKSISPNEKKKIDQGIDTIFDKIELTSEKAKDLEKPESPTIPNESETPPAGTTVNINNETPTPTPTPALQTQEKKKEKRKWPKPVENWLKKVKIWDDAQLKEAKATNAYYSALYQYCLKNENFKNFEHKLLSGTFTEDEARKLDQEYMRRKKELEKDFQKTDEGKKAFKEMADAGSATKEAGAAAQEAGKYIDPEVKSEALRAEAEAETKK